MNYTLLPWGESEQVWKACHKPSPFTQTMPHPLELIEIEGALGQ